MRRREFLLAMLVLTTPTTALSETPSFAVGQIWTLRPPLNPESRIRIGRIEDDGVTVHISLWGVTIADSAAAGPIASPLMAGHLPIAAHVLAQSVDHMVDEPAPTDLGFEEGYQTWKDARGGVFTITVPEIVDAILQTARSGQAG